MSLRVAVDIGGTFTDAAILDEKTGKIQVSKSPTTPKAPVKGVLACINKICIDPQKAAFFMHGTTVATNAIIQREMEGKVGLISTRGFRDVLEIMRVNRPMKGLYNIQWDKPIPLVPRYLRLEVTERIDYQGNIIKPLNEEEARKVVRRLKKLGVRAIAVSFIFSFMNPKHEKKMKEIIYQEYPKAFISCSHEVNAQIREYERTSTVVIDAYIKPVLDRYLQNLEEGLDKAGFKTNLMIMRSSGGVMSSLEARKNPVHLIESGPAGGVIGSAFLSGITGFKNMLTVDMGGTTFKVGIVDGGTPRYISGGKIAWGIPFRAPMVDISEIGTGGGSIAWIDSGGLLKVGPHSAGAEPGPVCYRRGGTEPTITDANLILGRLDPEYFLGGEMILDKESAEDAIYKKIAKPLEMDVIDAAQGIIEIANSAMLGSMRVASVERGYDPRDFVTIAYGGAGPMVSGLLAKELGCPLLIIPIFPGIFSAIGMLVADIRFDSTQTYIVNIEEANVDKINDIYDRLELEGVNNLRRQGYLGETTTMRTADLRYIGQNYEVTTPVLGGRLSDKDLSVFIDNFNIEHKKLYGHYKTDELIELVSLMITTLGITPKPKPRKIEEKKDAYDALKYNRSVFYKKLNDFIKTPIYERRLLGSHCSIEGPAIIEEMDSTIIVYPNQTATIDVYGNIYIELN